MDKTRLCDVVPSNDQNSNNNDVSPIYNLANENTYKSPNTETDRPVYRRRGGENLIIFYDSVKFIFGGPHSRAVCQSNYGQEGIASRLLNSTQMYRLFDSGRTLA